MARVKAIRRYDASGRAEQARRSREAIIEIARQEFLRGGYATTTVAAIARKAGVSVETIYKGFGGKPGLVRAIVERGLAGDGPVPAEQRSDHIRDTEPDPRQILTAWGTFTAEIGPRVAPILTLARDAAASDPDIAAVLEQISAARLARMTVNARGLSDAGHLRPGITPAEAADILWTYSSPELYELLVISRGWRAGRYGQFIAHALITALLPGEST